MIMSDSGRYYVTTPEGRTFWVEPNDPNEGKQKLWGDLDPATKKLTGDYGNKNRGAVHPDDSIITKENGFKNITTLGPGESPMDYINKLLKENK